MIASPPRRIDMTTPERTVLATRAGLVAVMVGGLGGIVHIVEGMAALCSWQILGGFGRSASGA